MENKKGDNSARIVFAGLLLFVMVGSIYLIAKTPINKLGQLKIKLPSWPTETKMKVENDSLEVIKEVTSFIPTNMPTTRNDPLPTIKSIITKSQRPSAKPTLACRMINITEAEFASNKCYAAADYNTLVSILPKYQRAKSDLQFANSSIKITCECRNPQACEFFKDSCERDKAAKARAEADLNLYRTQIQLLIGRGR